MFFNVFDEFDFVVWFVRVIVGIFLVIGEQWRFEQFRYAKSCYSKQKQVKKKDLKASFFFNFFKIDFTLKIERIKS